MSLEPTIEDQELLAAALGREHSRMTLRELLSGAAAGLSLLGAVAVLWAIHPPGSFALGPALLCAAVLVAASRVTFDTPFGFTVLTQLAFVPLLFAVPPVLAPLAVGGALAAAKLPGVVRGTIPPLRMFQALGNAWFAVGPAAVFVLAHVNPENAGAAVLLAALAAEFAVDFVVSSLRYSYSWHASFAAQLRETWVYGIDAALSPIAWVVARQVPAEPLIVLTLLPLLGLLWFLAAERRKRLESLVELNNAYRGTALVLGDVVEADDGYTGAHSRGVVALSLAVAERLGLDPERRRNLEFAALLHDVGKIAVPKSIINKPGKLSPEEWTVIKTHTIEGQGMLDRVGGFMREVGAIVRSHHERWDGGGYPDGLAGEAIPLEARIISCCDTWNAMRTDRAYRRALSYEVAVTELRAVAGAQLDPRVVDALLAVVGDDVAPSHNGRSSEQPAAPGHSPVDA
jgi:putative nucleotidyltransferase with HDIG domain